MSGHHPIGNPTVTRFYGTFLGTLAGLGPSAFLYHVVLFYPAALLLSGDRLNCPQPSMVDCYVMYRIVGFD